jgi:DNA polymerase III epsilon subunit-like protein
MFYCVMDSETGGLDQNDSDMLTFYVGLFDQEFQKVDELYLKLKPDNGRLPIAHADALKVNGIDLSAHLEDPETITYSEGNERLTDMLRKYYKKEGKASNLKAVGHNLPFDQKFVWKYLMPFSQWEKLFHYKGIDTMQRVDFLKECSWLPPELGTLSTINDYFGLPKRAAHNAKEDSLMCLDVYRKLIEIMKDKKENTSSAQVDIISMLEAE